MKALKSITALATMAAAALVFAPLATADNDDTFRLDKLDYAPGEKIHLLYDLSRLSCQGPVTSPGFVAPVEFAPEDPAKGVGQAIDTPGTYQATATCAGGVVSRTFSITVIPPAEGVNQWIFDQDEVEAGGTIHVRRSQASECTGDVTSHGFAAPIKFTADEGFFNVGQGKAVATPGTYDASMICKGKVVVRKLTVKAKAKAPEQPKAKPPVVKPKGAPQTGGGATA